MTYTLFLIPVALLILALWRAERLRDSERQAALKLLTATIDEWTDERKATLEQLAQARQERANEIATERAELKAERDQWAKERTQLLNRIQAPEVAAFQPADVSSARQHVAFDDDEDVWNAISEMNGTDGNS